MLDALLSQLETLGTDELAIVESRVKYLMHRFDIMSTVPREIASLVLQFINDTESLVVSFLYGHYL